MQATQQFHKIKLKENFKTANYNKYVNIRQMEIPLFLYLYIFNGYFHKKSYNNQNVELQFSNKINADLIWNF
ncbi:hypothetical protein DM482_06290 [Avibacterium paragallinarum]|uniref:Uncharacterized protein n=1 Tax=Avibacterium paragallinarum TaxID=728 RepID=A0AAE5TI65_AVIPA|nr:hypothetical protein C3364_08160 [Avibacterium paragallinarum]PXZ38998.1 hypothetical protein DM482_06290 [Avibacterium paragallinarum]PXZ41183.1 hypothetical protein DM481_07540 [Avibacterium paragallinarum]